MNRSTIERRWLRIAANGVLLAATAAVPCWAQDTASAAPAPAPAVEPAAAESTAAVDPEDQSITLEEQTVVTPEAQAVLDRMQATLASLDRFSVTAEATRDEVLTYGYKIQHTEHASMQIQRPNRLRASVDGDIKTRTYVYDGSQLTMYAPDKNAYAVSAAPGTIGELVGTLLDKGVEMPLVDMLYNGVAGNLTEDVRVGLLVGESRVDGVLTDHLAFRQADIDWQLWVEKGANALPRKMVITTRYSVGDPQYAAVMRWDLSPKFDAKTFTFAPPAGTTKIPYHTDLVSGGEK